MVGKRQVLTLDKEGHSGAHGGVAIVFVDTALLNRGYGAGGVN